MYKTIKALTFAATLAGCITPQKTLPERLVEENVCHGKGRVMLMEDKELAKKTAEGRAMKDYFSNCLSRTDQFLVLAQMKEVPLYVEYNPNTREAITYNVYERH